jgi:activating signal cointegrator 1
MKVLSLNPPYATLIAACQRYPELGKHIETRGRWHYTHRGDLLIHQTAGLGEMFADEDELAEFCQQEPFRSTLAALGITEAAQLPRGAIVARCELVSVVSTRQLVMTNGVSWQSPRGQRYTYVLTERERAFGNYEPGRYALLLADIQALATPIPARGMPGLRDHTGDIAL